MIVPRVLFRRIATSAVERAEEAAPHREEPPIFGARADRLQASSQRVPLRGAEAPTRFTAPPPTAPIANAPPMSSKMRCGQGSRPRGR